MVPGPLGHRGGGRVNLFGHQLNMEGAVWGSGLTDPAGGGFSRLGWPACRFLVGPAVGSS